MLASDVHRDHLCHAAKGVPRRIKEMPSVALMLDSYIATLWLVVRHVSPQSSPDDLAVHRVSPHPHIGVKWNLREFLFWNESLRNSLLLYPLDPVFRGVVAFLPCKSRELELLLWSWVVCLHLRCELPQTIRLEGVLSAEDLPVHEHHVEG